jgi:Cd2+/Zn2+-exporting ATPase
LRENSRIFVAKIIVIMDKFKDYTPVVVAFILLMSGILLSFFDADFFNSERLRIIWYAIAFAPVGLPVIYKAVKGIAKKDVFNENMLMSLASLGAFAIGEYAEAVAVMLFYAVGELFQDAAVDKAKSNISALLDVRPDEVTVIRDNKALIIKAEDVEIGDIVQLKSGEKLGLDGVLISESASFNTSALTGESKPDTKRQGESVLAGMLNINTLALVKVTAAYHDSKLSRILDLVQNTAARKAPTELFIHKFAKIYTPAVVALATAIVLLPYLFLADYKFDEWLYSALIFLVISCPCALVISIPLGYFGGIGAASRNGILIKGSNYLDILASVRNVVMDKTGTLTEGVFKVQEAVFGSEYNKNDILKMVNALESVSTHPIATAIHEFAGEPDMSIEMKNIEEIVGYGLRAQIEGKELLAGNFKMMDKFGISYDVVPDNIVYSVVAIAYDRKFVGYLTVADNIKDDARQTIDRLKQLGVKPAMLSGDKSTVTQYVAKELGIESASGDLLPEDKVYKVEQLKACGETVAFIGDGVNDAPVIALSDVGIAMGGLGSDAAIETADVVIQDDKPSKIPVAINIGKQTKRVVWQNITLAFVVKAAVMVLGAGGLATMWEAVFADVGVALLAILNAVRIQRMKF